MCGFNVLLVVRDALTRLPRHVAQPVMVASAILMIVAVGVTRLLDDEILARAVGEMRVDVARARAVELDDGCLLRVLLAAGAVGGVAVVDCSLHVVVQLVGMQFVEFGVARSGCAAGVRVRC